MVDVFDYSEDYQVAHDSVGGDHWYLNYVSGANGHGNLDLVTNGNKDYSVIIFGASNGAPFTIETQEQLCEQMFQTYPFLGIVRMENGYTNRGANTNNLFQVSHNTTGTRTLSISNPTNDWGLVLRLHMQYHVQ